MNLCNQVCQPSQHVDNMENSQDRHLALNPRQVMSPKPAISIQPLEADMFNVPDLPFSQTQRNEIFSERSSRV